MLVHVCNNSLASSYVTTHSITLCTHHVAYQNSSLISWCGYVNVNYIVILLYVLTFQYLFISV